MGILRLAPRVISSFALVFAIVLALSACNDELPRDAFIRLRLDTESVGSGCASSQCSDYGMSCGATLSIRATDPATGVLLRRQTGEPLAICIDVPSDADICALEDLADSMQIFGLPPRTMRIEVVLWNKSDAPAGDCPGAIGFELFDALGRPQANFPVQPAFAGAAYFRAHEDNDVSVPIWCPNPAKLETSCIADLPTTIRASVLDMENVQLLREKQATDIMIAAGEARAVTNELGESFFVLEAVDTYPLPLDPEAQQPVFISEDVPRRFSSLVCASALEGVAQATSAVTCEEVIPEVESLDLQPLYLSKELLEKILDALALEQFPEEGLVVGRVVSADLTPSSDVDVSTSSGSVIYLNDDLSDLIVGGTSSSGFFVSLDMEFASRLTAQHVDGREHAGTPIAGLVREKVSTVLVRLQGPVVGE